MFGLGVMVMIELGPNWITLKLREKSKFRSTNFHLVSLIYTMPPATPRQSWESLGTRKGSGQNSKLRLIPDILVF